MMTLTSKFTAAKNQESFVYNDKDKNGYGVTVGVNLSPLANCQTFSVRSAYRLIAGCKSEEIRGRFFEIAKAMDKRQVLIDIDTGYLSGIENAFKPEQFLVKSPYRNSTGTKMVICLIKIW